MTFFDDLPLPTVPQLSPPPDAQPWVGPPTMEIPGVSSETLILADTAEVAVAVSRICGYTTGFAFDLMVRLRSAPQQIKLFEAMRARAVDELARPDAFKLGIQLGDGPKTEIGRAHV